MGAMIRFKEETGREATGIQPDAVSDLAVYLWCCVVSACRREGVEFKYQLMDFADRIADETVADEPTALVNFLTEKDHPVLQMEPMM